MSEIRYTKLSSAKKQETRNLVVSECSRGGYTLAQQINVEEDGKRTNVFLKNAIHVSDIDKLINLRDALNIAIEKTK